MHFKQALLSGERSKAFHVLMSGSASMEVTGDFCSVCIQALAPGDAFGWSSLLDYQDTLFQVMSMAAKTIRLCA